MRAAAKTLQLLRRGVWDERFVDDDLFLIDDASGTIHHLNMTAAAIWRLLAEPMTQNQIIAAFRAAFPEQPGSFVKKAIRDSLKQFAGIGLVERRRA